MSRQVQAWHRVVHGTELPIEPAAESAAGLLSLADRLTTAGVPFDALLALSPGDVAEHWQSNVQFLKIVLEHYPAWLEGRADKATLDRTRLHTQAAAYRTRGSAAPVVAAGFADTTPAGVEVLTAIVDLPNGHVVLPGFDPAASPPDPFHPQYALHRLVTAVGAAPADVVPLCPAPPRAQVWGQVLAPAAEVERWRSVQVGQDLCPRHARPGPGGAGVGPVAAMGRAGERLGRAALGQHAGGRVFSAGVAGGGGTFPPSGRR